MNLCLVAILLSITPCDLERVDWHVTNQHGVTTTYTASLDGDVFGRESLPDIAIDRNANWVLNPRCQPWPLITDYRPRWISYESTLVSKYGMPSQAYMPQLTAPIAAYSSLPRTVQDPVNRHYIEDLDESDTVTWRGLLAIAGLVTSIVLMFFVPAIADIIRRNKPPQSEQDTEEDSAVHRDIQRVTRSTKNVGGKLWR